LSACFCCAFVCAWESTAEKTVSNRKSNWRHALKSLPVALFFNWFSSTFFSPHYKFVGFFFWSNPMKPKGLTYRTRCLLITNNNTNYW
jgi:hypothetical protein